MKWEKQTGKYETGENLLIGNVVVGSAYYNGLRSKEDPKAYKAGCQLPSMERMNSIQYMTMDEAKKAAEDRVKHWMKITGMEFVQ